MSIHLGEVLFPLRYDVWDQAPVLRRLMRKYGDDTLRMMEAGIDTVIHQHVVIADPAYQAIGVLKPLAGAELVRRIERYYGARMTKLTDYYRSINEGWDRSEQRIYYKRVSNPTVTTAGNPVPDGIFLSDGQHRTIALMALGYTELPDHIAAVEPRDGADFLPLDMTWPYIKAGDCTEQRFVDFARFRFPDIPKRVALADELYEWAYTHALDWLCTYIRLYWR